MKKDKKIVNEAPVKIIAGIPEAKEIEETKTKKKKLKRSQKKSIRKAVLAVSLAVIVLAVSVASVFVFPVLIEKEYNKDVLQNMPMLYVKSGAVMKYYSPETGKVSDIASSLFDQNSSSPYLPVSSTRDGKTIFFIDSMGDLYKRDLSTEENVCVDAYVKAFVVSKNNKLCYLLEETGELYLVEKPLKKMEKKLIDSGVTDFKLSENGSKIVYTKANSVDNTKSDLYKYEKSIFGGKTSLVLEDCGKIYETFGLSFNRVYLLKETAEGKELTLIKDLKNPKVVAEKFDEVYSITENGNVIYGVSDGMSVSLSTFFTDKNLQTDTELGASPDFSDLLYGEMSQSEFDAMMKNYLKKDLRDVIREMISDKGAETKTYNVFISKDGAKYPVCEKAVKFLGANEDNSMAVFQTSQFNQTMGASQVDISEFGSEKEAEDAINRVIGNRKNAYKVYVGKSKKSKTLFEEDAIKNDVDLKSGAVKTTEAYVDETYSGIYLYEKMSDSETGTMKYIDMQKGNIGSPSLISDKVTGELVLKDGKLFWNDLENALNILKTASKGVVSTVDIDAVAETVGFFEDGKVSLYLKNYNEEEQMGTLVYNLNGAQTVVSERSIGFAYRSQNNVYFVEKSAQKGYVLYHFDGVSKKAIDEFVINVVAF